jgi:hypothetical protein
MRPEPRSRGSVIAEGLLLAGIAVIAVVWIIPIQTTGAGVGLPPGFVPTLCAGALGALVLLDGLMRLVRTSQSPGYPSGWSALVRLGSVAILGAAVLQVVDMVVCALITIPAGMLALGERRWIMIVGTAAVVTGCLALVVR